MGPGTIVVGVDGSPGAEAALAWAVEEARLRGARLVALHAWRIPLSVELPEPAILGHPVLPEPGPADVAEQLAAVAGRVLDGALDAVDLTGIDIERRLVEAAPAGALLDAARSADLLVLGSRGRGGFTGLLLGSVGAQCAHHASCPVVIVPRSARPGDQSS